jgi:DNA modification methylase
LATKHEALFHLVRQPRYFYDLDAIREPQESTSEETYAWRVGPGQPPLRRRQRRDAGRQVVPQRRQVNPGDVWTIPTQPYPDAHFAVFPPELVRRPILATVPEGGTVLDPFFGSGTTAVMARRLGRKTVGVELNPDYCRMNTVARVYEHRQGGAA